MGLYKLTTKELISSEKKNIVFIKLLGWVLVLGVLIEFINTIAVQKFHTADTTLLTLLIYITLLAIIMSKVIKYKGLTIKGLIIYFLILLLFLLNYMIFENSRLYLLETNMLLIYFFFIPIAIFVVNGITDWSKALDIFRRFGHIAVFISTLGVMLIGYKEHVNYMEFSYSLLPFLIILYYAFRIKSTFINLFTFIIGFINVIVFGARAPILFLFLFIIFYELLKFKKSGAITKVIFIISSMTSLLSILFLSKTILQFLERMAELTNSRFLIKMLNNELFISNTRDIIYEEARYALEHMGFGMYGLFGDRLVVSSVYVHNIFYEILLSFGFIFGGIVILLLVFIIIKTTIFNKDIPSQIMAIFFTTAFFLRYFISGSFVIEGDFYIYIAVMLNICQMKGRIIKVEKG